MDIKDPAVELHSKHPRKNFLEVYSREILGLAHHGLTHQGL